MRVKTPHDRHLSTPQYRVSFLVVQDSKQIVGISNLGYIELYPIKKELKHLKPWRPTVVKSPVAVLLA